MFKIRPFYLLGLFIPAIAQAEIDKIYHPYVEAYKTEIEYQMLYKNDKDSLKDGIQIHRLSVGHAINEKVAIEAKTIGKHLPSDSFDIHAYELETKVQLTEQGEYWSDWGLLFEVSRNTNQNYWETSTGLLWEKEWGRVITSANFFIEYELGSGIKNEFETAFHSQIKYRLSRYLEPALELYMDEETRGIGPVILGSHKIGFNNLNWEIGCIFAFNQKTSDQNLRLLIDYEF